MSAVPEGVGATALLTAFARAEESERADRLFGDPWARRFLDAALDHDGEELPFLGMARPHDPSELWTSFRAYFTARTPFYDDGVRAAVDAGVRQVVLLAAGVDSRAFRLDLPPDTVVYEVDSASVLAFKDSVLTRHGARPVCRRVPVPADLRDGWIEELAAAGLRPDEPIVWVAEGLLMYFDSRQSNRFLATISDHSVGGAHLLFEYFGRLVEVDTLLARADDEADRSAAHMLASLATEGPAEEPEPLLHRLGWHPEVTTIETLIRTTGRTVPSVFADSDDRIEIWLVAGTRPTGAAGDGRG